MSWWSRPEPRKKNLLDEKKEQVKRLRAAADDLTQIVTRLQRDIDARIAGDQDGEDE